MRIPSTVTFSMCPYRDTWVMSQKARAALKYMSGVGAEPSPPRFGPSSQANVLCAAPLWLTVASFKNGVTDATSASNTISRRWMVGSRPSGSCAMGPPSELVAVDENTARRGRHCTHGKGARGGLGGCRSRGRHHQSRQDLLSAGRLHQARPGEVLRGGRGRRAPWHHGPADR